MEKLVWRSSSSQAKVLGTVASIAGALIVILYKGPSIIIFSSQNSSNGDDNFLYSSNSKWITGGFLLIIENIITSVWFIVQAQILKEYPAEIVIIFFYNLFATIISGAISFVAEHERAAWILKLDISLAAIVSSGLFGCLCGFIYMWILQHKGPVYIAMFKPLSIAIATVMGIIFLGDTLHIGSIIGAIVISLGFYAVIWGKVTEEIYEDFAFAPELESSSERVPLLTNPKVDNA